MKEYRRRLTARVKSILWIYVILVVSCAGSIYFIHHNEMLYDRPIAEVVSTALVEQGESTDVHGNADTLTTQKLVGVLKNSKKKGQTIELLNDYSKSGAYDQKYEAGDKIFVTIRENPVEGGGLAGEVIDLKRDGYVVMIGWLFVFILLLIGRRKGLFALISFTVNVLLLTVALDLYVDHFPSGLLVITGICAILFTAISLLLVSGFNDKTYAAIVATLIGTAVSLAIACLVIWMMAGKGLRYEEMQFLTRPYQTVFIAGLFIGSLGAIMDVAITISTSLFALHEQNPDITESELRASGLEIGKDVMGTITSILFFAYLTGSLPMLILYLKNAAPLSFAFPMNLSLEVARALTGGIGIVLTIPIALHTVLYFIKRRRAAV